MRLERDLEQKANRNPSPFDEVERYTLNEVFNWTLYAVHTTIRDIRHFERTIKYLQLGLIVFGSLMLLDKTIAISVLGTISIIVFAILGDKTSDTVTKAINRYILNKAKKNTSNFSEGKSS